MNEPAPLLEIRDACRGFRSRRALQSVSLRLAAGEMLALLGPNGAGKTTLMRAVTGRLALDSGSVRIAGLDPRRDPAARVKLGIVPQAIALYPHLTVRENLDVFARLLGLKGAAVGQAVERALHRARLADRAGELLPQLSGGMQRRLNIVAGTLHEPRLLLLDEPTVGVDMHAREAIHTLLHELRDAGMAIMISTHDFDQATDVADRAAFMAEGRLLEDGPIGELLARYFGTAKEGMVTLVEAATPEVADILTSAGLKPVEAERVWAGPVTGGYTAFAALEAKLEATGVHVDELRLREPHLGAVFREVIERRAAA